MSRKKKLRSRPRTGKVKKAQISKPNRSKKGVSQFIVEEEGLPRLLMSMEGLPKFLVDAKAAVETGHTDEATALLNDQAMEIVRQMLEEDPSRIDIMLLVAIVFTQAGPLSEAERWYKKIAHLDPHPIVLNDLACIYNSMGHRSMAMEYRKKALEAAPDNASILGNFAVDLVRAGKVREGIDLLRRAVEKDADNVLNHTNYLWYLHYLPEIDPHMLLEEHKRWGQAHAPPSLARVSHDNDTDPNRRLRVGYVSPDFRVHSAAYNFEAFLSGRDHQAVEVYGYGSVTKPDEMTERLKRQFDHYRNIRGLRDRTVADMIERDKIDILVEIGGHSGDNRLLVLAYKPAPIQVDYGGINTSGMEQIDYRFTDSLLDSPETEKFYIEEPAYLPGGLFCYIPPYFAPPVTPPPAIRRGYATFGSFNNYLKIHPDIVSLWAQVLKANDGSRFLMKFRGGNDHKVAEHYLQQFELFGIDRDRVQVYGYLPSIEHLQLYGEVDIILDTYPFNGCITTLEGLWMGVPAISLVGTNSLLSRVGLSILSRLDMDFFAASTPEEYVAKATGLAANLDALAKMRVSMRQRMAASVLCDAKGYAGGIEAAYRKMWHRWCRNQGVDIPPEATNSAALQSNTGSSICSRQLTQTQASLDDEWRKEPSAYSRTNPNQKLPDFIMQARAAFEAGRVDKAICIYERGISQGHKSGAVYKTLGDMHLWCKKYEKAIACLQKARYYSPDSVELLDHMVLALTSLGRLDEAVEEVTKTLNSYPDTRIANGSLTQALLLISSETFDDEIGTDAEQDAMSLLAEALFMACQFEKAEDCYRKMLRYSPTALVYAKLAHICRFAGRLSEATEHQRKAVENNPDNADYLANLGTLLISLGKIQEGVNISWKAVKKNPDHPKIRSTFLANLHYLPNVSQQMLFDEHVQWGPRHAPVSMARTSHDNDPDADRRLRIGYISPDFRVHSAAYNFEPFLTGRDPRAVEVFGYGNVAKPDEMTERLKRHFDHYRSIRGLSDEAVVRIIEEDRIDILVEIAGHVGDHRLLVMAYKPAPIQVDFGGIDTSGMEQIDYRFTDSLLDSPQAQEFYTEELVYLPGGLICYQPPDFAPPVASLPAVRKGHITFGTFNTSLKINSHIISLWAQVLKANDGSLFLMKFRGGGDQNVAEHYLQQFEQFGIGRERVQICGRLPSVEHLQLYGEVDIALDTYPFNGCITTLEGLWMGVPIISLASKELCFPSRVGLSILSRLDMEAFAASTPEEYIAKATALAANLDALAKIRVSMRQRMTASVLCDVKAYAGSVEAAYREMWRRWCGSRNMDGTQDKLEIQTGSPELDKGQTTVSTATLCE